MRPREERGIKVIIGAPFASRLLTNSSAPGLMYGYGPVPEEFRACALAIEAACREHGVPLMAAALQFPLLHQAVVSVIPGAVTPDKVRQNKANVARAIPGELWAALKTRGLNDKAAPVGG
jgi:D-threo-aldose 1-dehydrogenase